MLLGPQAAALLVVQTALEALQSMNENSSVDHSLQSPKQEREVGALSGRHRLQIDPGGLLQVALVGFELVVKATLTQVLFVESASNSTRLKSLGRQSDNL